ncbi:hypothetical protein OAV88_04155, partial [bacterium]|nr:hypothetical protein [bacterium]
RKEAEIEEANREHLRMIRNALQERERLNESKRQHRVETLKMSKLLEKDRLVAEVYKKRTTNLRKLSNKRQISESKLYNPKQTRNVIRDYTNFGSNVYVFSFSLSIFLSFTHTLTVTTTTTTTTGMHPSKGLERQCQLNKISSHIIKQTCP